MGNKNQVIQIVSISTAITLSHISIASGEKLPKPTDLRNSSVLITQAGDSPTQTPEIIKPAQQPIESIEKLNPSGNRLSFPTQAKEVQVGTQQPITLDQAIELSLQNNKDIEESRLQVGSAEAALDQEKAALLPTLDLTSGLSYGSDFFLDGITQQSIDETVEETLEANPNLSEEAARTAAEDRFTNPNASSFDFNGGLSLNYDLFTSGSRGAAIRAATKQLRNAELDLERIIEQTRFETARDYYNLQNSDAQVEIQKAAVADASQTLKDAQLLEKAGLGTRFDVLRAEVELAQAEQRLTTAKANQNIARRQLAETLSIDHSADLATADAIKEAGIWDMELEDTIIQAFKNRAELEQFLLQREIAQEQKTIALANVKPTLSANADYTLSEDFQDDFDISDRYSLGLNLQWRLFDGGSARSAAKQAEKNAEIAETQFANQRNQIRFAVEQAFFQLNANQNNINTATKEVELAEESLRLARLRFQAGVGTQTDVIEAQTQLTTARGSYLTSITDYNQSYADLQRQVSNTPDNSLQDLP